MDLEEERAACIARNEAKLAELGLLHSPPKSNKITSTGLKSRRLRRRIDQAVQPAVDLVRPTSRHSRREVTAITGTVTTEESEEDCELKSAHERMEAIQNVPEPSQGDLPGLQGIPVEVREMASKIGFEIGSRPFQLFYTAYEKWKSDFKPAFNSPGSAKATMDMFSTLYEMGFRERDLLDQQQVNRVSLKTFKESVKPKMVHMVPPNFINGLEAAFEAVANPNPRK
ncbi:hypothetical protein VOLCADRAFT_103085, partial [Volvox carteri f. nagariensis]